MAYEKFNASVFNTNQTADVSQARGKATYEFAAGFMDRILSTQLKAQTLLEQMARVRLANQEANSYTAKVNSELEARRAQTEAQKIENAFMTERNKMLLEEQKNKYSSQLTDLERKVSEKDKKIEELQKFIGQKQGGQAVPGKNAPAAQEGDANFVGPVRAQEGDANFVGPSKPSATPATPSSK